MFWLNNELNLEPLLNQYLPTFKQLIHLKNLLIQVFVNIMSYLSRLLSTLLLFAVVFFSSCENPREKWDQFGAEIALNQDVSTSTMIASLKDADSVDVQFVGEIDQVCQMKGCWMTLKTEDGSSLRVTFKDYGFFVPKDAAGKKVIVSGKASIQQLDEATARHYAEDAGKEYDSTAVSKEISIVANGVLIEKANQL